jgi:putative inorganic carbon (hco3(-)) transporter
MNKSVVLFVLTYLGGLTATVLIDLSYGVYLYQLHYFLNPIDRWWYGSLPHIRYSFIIAVFMLIGFFRQYYPFQENRLRDLPQVKWLVAMMIMLGIVFPQAVWPSYHETYTTLFVKLMFFLAIAYKCIDTPTKFERMLWVYLIGNFYVGWVAHDTGRTANWRLEGVGMTDSVNSNGAAAVLITSVPIFIFYLIKGRPWQRIASLGCLAYVFDGIILINSRGAFLALFVAGLYFAFMILREKFLDRSIKFKIVAIGLAGVALFVYLADEAFWERMGTIVGHVTGEQTEEMSRVYYWKKSLEVAARHPFGAGVHGYNYYSPQLLPEKYLTEGGTRSVHSTYFQALAELGYLGPILLFGFILSNFRMAWRVQKYVRDRGNDYLYLQMLSITSAYIAFLVAAAFLDRLYAEVMYWLPMFIASYANIYKFKGYAERENLDFSLIPKRVERRNDIEQTQLDAGDDAIR